jgi:hypothetical protein
MPPDLMEMSYLRLFCVNVHFHRVPYILQLQCPDKIKINKLQPPCNSGAFSPENSPTVERTAVQPLTIGSFPGHNRYLRKPNFFIL